MKELEKAMLDSNKIPISELRLSKDTYNALHRSGYCYLSDLEGKTEKDFYKIRNIGRKGAEEIIQAYSEYNKSMAVAKKRHF